jgi:NAD(P)-dependent dehydrogenase (short-subunit alcohol dehydrogenase family)
MRHVVITGAGSGLGRTTAAKFHAAGDRVYGCDISAESISDLRQSGIAAYAEVVDVSQRAQVDRFFDAVWERTGRVDVLINNVGVPGPRGMLEDIDPSEWAQTIDANLSAAFWSLRRVLAPMKRAGGGAIINVSTFSARTFPEGRSPYTVSKAALEALTRAIAREAGPHNVTCNAVQPGAMDNDRLTRVLKKIADEQGKTVPEVEREQLQFMSMRSKVSMDEVAALVHFLASEAAAHITSQVIALDAGAQWEA